MGVYAFIPNARQDDERNLFFAFRFGHEKAFASNTVSVFHGFKGLAPLNRVKSDFFKSLSCFEVTVSLVHESSDLLSEKLKFFAVADDSVRLERIHVLSTVCGDITLIVKVKNDENEDLYAPPAKKQKRNHNKKENENENESNVINNNNNKETKLKASSVILIAGSPVFSSILLNETAESDQRTIIVHAKSVKDVEDLLFFMSTNELKPDCNVFNVIQLDHFYQMKQLELQCVNKLIQNISVKNFVATINLFDRYEIVEEYQALIDFAKKNLDELKKEPNFLQLSHTFRCGTLGIK